MTIRLVRAARRCRIQNLRDGALFETDDGVRAVKSEYGHWQQPDCILLQSGEYAHFPESGATLVWELRIVEEAA
jgi:hypothetical protein